MSPAVEAYLASPLPVRERPLQDRIVVWLDEHPDATRREVAAGLHITYWTVVAALEQLVASGWVAVATQKRPGLRSTLVYRVSVPNARGAAGRHGGGG